METRGQKNGVLFHRVICLKIQIPRPHPKRTAPKLSGERPSFFPCLEVSLGCSLCLTLHILCSRLAWLQEVLWRCHAISLLLDFALPMPPWWLMVRNPSANAGDMGSILGLGRSPGGGHGNPLQYSCLENPMDRGDWWTPVHSVAKSQTQLSD